MLVALRVLLQVLPEGGALRGCCQSGVRASNHAFGAGMLVSGCLWKVLLEGAVKLACWCRCRVLLQGAAVKVVCALELACWCHCRMLLQGSQNTSSDLANVPRFRIGKFEA